MMMDSCVAFVHTTRATKHQHKEQQRLLTVSASFSSCCRYFFTQAAKPPPKRAASHRRHLQQTSMHPKIELRLLDISGPTILFPLVNGSILDLSVLPPKMTVEAAVTPVDNSTQIVLVDFAWDSSLVRKELEAPYYMGGDGGLARNNKPKPCRRFTVGPHTLQVTVLFEGGVTAMSSVTVMVQENDNTVPTAGVSTRPRGRALPRQPARRLSQSRPQLTSRRKSQPVRPPKCP